MANPALDAFVTRIIPEFVLAQVLVRKIPGGFELAHVLDRDEESLRAVTIEELRDIAQFTAGRKLRPLKSAPTLQRGWKFIARDSSELNDALQCLYPGAIADWFAAQRTNPPVTHYRAFTGRQTGMYRVTATLSDTHVEQLARACCANEFCLKQRLWSVEGSNCGQDAGKSAIPCLEPCAVLLEFARTVARIEEQERRAIPLALAELETCMAVLERAAQSPDADLREADFSGPGNPRRTRLLLDRIRTFMTGGSYEND